MSSVAAAIITYNRSSVLRQSLAALLAQTRQLDEIIIVDNASYDGTAVVVAKEFPSVRLVRMSENTGAAGGFAEGLSEAVGRGHDWVWVFNDDDVAEPDALEVMLSAAARLPARTGLLGCGRRGADGVRYALGASWKHRHVPVPPTDPGDPPVSVDVVTFSGTLVRAEAVRNIGVPKREYFMMVEDLEYCLRARRAGWEVFVLPRPLTTSLTLGSSDSTAAWRGYYQTRNQLAMTLEHRSLLELIWWFARTMKFCAGAIRARHRPAERIRLRSLGVLHAIRGLSGRTIPPASPS